MKISDLCFKDKCPICKFKLQTFNPNPTYFKCQNLCYTLSDKEESTEILINHVRFFLKIIHKKSFDGFPRPTNYMLMQRTEDKIMPEVPIFGFTNADIGRIVVNSRDVPHLISKILTRLLLK